MWQLFNALFMDPLEFGLFTEAPRDQERDENRKRLTWGAEIQLFVHDTE